MLVVLALLFAGLGWALAVQPDVPTWFPWLVPAALLVVVMETLTFAARRRRDGEP